MKRFMAAAAIAPLCFAAGAARAETAISTATTTPVATATANAGAPDDVHITTAGSITLNSGTAVTLNSDNKVTAEGPIKIEDTATPDGSNGNIGVLILAGHTGLFTGSSSILVDDTVATADTNADGVPDGPFATRSDRYGIRLMGPGVFTGISGTAITTTGSITVKGNTSAAVSIESAVNGAISLGGFMSVTGDHSYGVHINGPVTGDVTVLGSVSARGEGSSAVAVDQAIDGKLVIWNAVSATGYGSTTRPTDTSLLTLIQTSPSALRELLKGGPALSIAGDVTGGVLLDLPVSVTDTSGVVTTTGGTSSVTSYGNAPAIQIGAATAPVHIGLAGTGTDAYGLLIRGNVDAEGVYDNVSATGIQIGGTGGTVALDGGLKLTGQVTALAYSVPALNQATSAVGLRIGDGADVPEILIDTSGSISVAAVSPAGNLPGLVARGIEIKGGSAPLLTNRGSIIANIAGDVGDSTAIYDSAGAIRQLTNTGKIEAFITPTVSTDTTVGKAIALDLRGNTAGVTVIQSQAPDVSTTDTSGVVTTTTPPAPVIVGDVMFGSGDANLQLLAGSLSGAVAFGTGQNSLTLDNGATLTGKLTNAGGLALHLTNGTLNTTNTDAISLTSLQIGASGTALFRVDPTANAYTRFTVSGAADLTTGAKLGLVFLSKVVDPTTFTLIQAGPGGSVTAGTVDASLLNKVPYFYTANLNVVQGAGGSVSVDIRRRTAAEAGLNAGEAKALDAVFDAFDRDPGVQAGYFAATDRSSFLHLYDQMLPDYSGAAFEAFASAMSSVSRAEAEAPLKLASNTGRGWTQEIGFQAQRSTGDAEGYRASGFGAIGGIERPDTGLGALGLSAAFLTSTVKTPGDPTDGHLIASSFIAGIYWRAGDPQKGLRLDAGVHGGYSWFGAHRILRMSDPATGSDVLNRDAKTSWSGAIVAAHVGAAYEQPISERFFVRPQVMADYVYLYEGAHNDRGGGDAFNLNVASRSSGQASAEADAVFGARFGTNLRWGPELKIGWREVFGKGPGDTTAVFASGGTPFTLSAQSLDKGGLVARGALRGGDQYADFAVEAGGEGRGDYRDYDARVVARFLF